MKKVIATAVLAAGFVAMSTAASADDTIYSTSFDAEVSAAGQPVLEVTGTSASYRDGSTWHVQETYVEHSVAGTGTTRTFGGDDVFCDAGITATTTCTVLDAVASLT